MSILKKLQGVFSCKGTLRIHEEAFGDATAIRILKHSNIQDLKRLFLVIPDDWPERYFYSLAMSRRFPIDMLRQWTEEEPHSPDAFLAYGARLLKWSWEARGYGVGASVTRDKWDEFYRRLDLTREALEECALLRPEDPTPWTYLIMVAVYGEYGEQEELQYFEYAVARDSENWPAHIHRLTGLSKKYGGTHEEMFRFATTSANRSVDGSLLPILLTKAHSEYWKYLYLFQDNEREANEYLAQRDVQEKTIKAYERSLGVSQYSPHNAVFARINAAGWFWLIREKRILRRELQELDGYLHDVHWRWIGINEGDLVHAKEFSSAS